MPGFGSILNGVTWKVGDLGRFLVEDKKLPRFEVLGSKPDRGVAIWYGGSGKSQRTFVPFDVFKSRCVNYWDIEVVTAFPDWLAPGNSFSVEDERASKVTQAVIRHNFNQQISQVDIRNHTLKIRQIRYDYTSCFDEDAQCLVMVPLRTITAFGQHVMTKLDRLMGDDIFGEDTIDKILDNL